MSEQAIRINAEQVARIEKLEAQLKEYEDERIGSAALMLELMGTDSKVLSKLVYSEYTTTGNIGTIYESQSTAKSAASRTGGRNGPNPDAKVVEFRLMPLQIIAKVNGKWPKKKTPKKKRKR